MKNTNLRGNITIVVSVIRLYIVLKIPIRTKYKLDWSVNKGPYSIIIMNINANVWLHFVTERLARASCCLGTRAPNVAPRDCSSVFSS